MQNLSQNELNQMEEMRDQWDELERIAKIRGNFKGRVNNISFKFKTKDSRLL